MKILGLIINILALVIGGAIVVSLGMPTIGVIVTVIGLFIGSKMMKNG